MNCQQCQDVLDDLLVSSPSKAVLANLTEHVATCSNCAREHELAGQTLTMLDLPQAVPDTSSLRERILDEISTVTTVKADGRVQLGRNRWVPILLKRPIVAVGLAASLLVTGLVLFRSGPNEASVDTSTFNLIRRAYAAEDAIFASQQVVHIVSKIDVKPIPNPLLARMRWFPIMSLEATGKTRLHQLKLSAEAGKGYTVTDETWYDAATGRFVRQLMVEGRPIYANSFDGQAVYWLETATDKKTAQVTQQEKTSGFRPPGNPVELLGIAAGLPAQIEAKNQYLVSEVGNVKLDDGTMARTVKSGFPGPDPDEPLSAYVLFTIREDVNTIAKIAFLVDEKPLFEVQRVTIETVAQDDIDWDLTATRESAGPAPKAMQASILPDMVKMDVSLEHMVEKASFPTYVFQTAPPWAAERKITDILDVASPPQRMFAITHRAKDGRHVVLIQAASYNRLGTTMAKLGRVLYTSPSGIEVLSGPRDKWLAGILLQSSQPMLHDAPSNDRNGYLLKTPEGTCPALAINGKLTEAELHQLIDSLLPTKHAMETSE